MNIRQEYYAKISAELKGNELTTAGSLGETIQQLCLKIGGQYAILGGSNIIQQKNIIQARKIVLHLVHTIIFCFQLLNKSIWKLIARPFSFQATFFFLFNISYSYLSQYSLNFNIFLVLLYLLIASTTTFSSA